jgi:uncharacterized cupredoxin-like copper-binding protein
MAVTTTDNGKNAQTVIDEVAEPSVEQRLGKIESEVREQGKTVRNAQRGWSIFALFALLIAGANLLVVAAKLDSKSSSNSTAAPAGAAGGASAAAPTPATSGKVGVSLKEFKVIPTASQAPAGHVTFNVHNGGTATHEFVVLRTDKPAGSLLEGARADESGNVGETGDLKAGASKSLALNLKPGHYALICNLPGHYAAGQHTDFTVR